MAWNEPGNNGKDHDPWGNNGKNQGPPDLDEMLRKRSKIEKIRMATAYPMILRTNGG